MKAAPESLPGATATHYDAAQTDNQQSEIRID
jgi:hypothetical protein